MRFNVSVRLPRERQKRGKRAFLEPRLVTIQRSPITEHPGTHRSPSLNVRVTEGQGATPREIVREQGGSGGVRFEGKRAKLRKKASRVPAVRSDKSEGVAIVSVGGKGPPEGPKSLKLEIARGEWEGLGKACLRWCGKSKNSSRRSVGSRAKRTIVRIA